jgi:sodium-dependent dicarboxylate transporter 2/3/5
LAATTHDNAISRTGLSRVALFLGPTLALALLLFGDLEPGRPEVTRTAAVALLMSIWWIGEALPLAITALLPIVLFPTLGIMSGKAVAPTYVNHVIFLFIGGFLVALAMERWHLHRRIALRVLLVFGTRPRRLLLGFMVASAFLSMWISNTATTMMMVPIVIAVLRGLRASEQSVGGRGTDIALLLGVAYGATLGGIATLVGTPPNLSFARIFEISFPDAPVIGFATWFQYGLPVSLILLVCVWGLLSITFLRRREAELPRNVIREQHAALGPIRFEEKVVLVDFVALVVLWLSRTDLRLGPITTPGWSRLFAQPEYLNDGVVAIALAMLLFIVPAGRGSGGRIMEWRTAERLPWNIVLLFGGGFALASGFVESGLSAWFGEQLQDARALHPLAIIAIICLLATFLTELTSNTATAEMLLPILAGLAVSIQINPLFIMVPATLSCSLAFMLPVATPPNAIIFGTNRLRIVEMARVGVWLNLIGVVVVTAATWWLARLVFEIDLATFPEWAGGLSESSPPPDR